jgi:hypothetical protein
VNSLEEVDSVLDRANPVDESTSAATLRGWRTELVRASVFVSYALGVLSLDVEILNRRVSGSNEKALQSVVDELPDALAAGWVGGGWSLSPDASASIAAAAEVTMDQSGGLLELHAQVATCDLGDDDVVQDLLARIEQERQELAVRRDQLENRIRRIQAVMLQHYGSGAASVDDWLA